MKVVIVGAGFSGTAVAFNLLRLGGQDLTVTIVERGERIGLLSPYAMIRSRLQTGCMTSDVA